MKRKENKTKKKTGKEKVRRHKERKSFLKNSWKEAKEAKKAKRGE